jgi:hypothetical protein
MSQEAGPDPQSPEGDVRTVLVGTIAWAVGFVALLPFWSRLEDGGHLWWVATCGCGFGLGLIGLVYTRRRARAIARDAAAAAGTSSKGPSSAES